MQSLSILGYGISFMPEPEARKPGSLTYHPAALLTYLARTGPRGGWATSCIQVVHKFPHGNLGFRV